MPRYLAIRITCVGPVLSIPDSSAPSPPGSSGSGLAQILIRDWTNASWSFFFFRRDFRFGFEKHAEASAPQRLHSCERAPDADRILEAGALGSRLVHRRIGCPHHRARPIPASILKKGGRGIDAFVGNIFQRHRPAPGATVPVADLQYVADHVVVGHLASAVFAAADGDRDRLGDRANPDFAMG